MARHRSSKFGFGVTGMWASRVADSPGYCWASLGCLAPQGGPSRCRNTDPALTIQLPEQSDGYLTS